MELRGYILNCFIGGEDVTVNPDGGWLRNQITVSFAGYDISIIQIPEAIRANAGDFRGHAIDTTEVIVSNVQQGNVEDYIEKLRGLTTLLSFVTCSQVVLRGWNYVGVVPSGEFWSVNARAGSFRPVLQLVSGRPVREFLEQVWPIYFQLEQPRKLRVAIDYYVSGQVLGLPLELKLITMFVLFENLKSTFALYRGYPYVDGWFRRPNGNRWNFKSLLIDMLDDVRMASPLDSIINLRNEIIHSGISQLSYAIQWEIYENCHDLFREYFMRLLGFSGSFFLYSGRGMKEKAI